MTIKEVRQNWIKEINSNLSKFNLSFSEDAVLRVYDASKERGMAKKLWLCGNGSDGKEMFFYAYITKKNEIKKYNGSVYVNVRSDFEEDVKNYKYLGRVD